MNGTVPARRGPGDFCMARSAENVAVDNISDISSSLNHACPEIPTKTTSPGVFDASPTHNRQKTVHTPRGLSANAGVSCLAEYLREERQTEALSLDSHLFPGGLLAGDVVEVWGNANCGKSMLTLTLIASALLPRLWSGIELGGCNIGVTLIDCDQHFSIFQLVSLMYRKVKACLKLAKDTLNKHNQDKTIEMKPIYNIQEVTDLLRNTKANLRKKIEEMVQRCLKSLYYIKCIESVQFPIVLASMDEHLAKHSDVSLVVVDSLSAFSWYDWIYRGNGRFVELKKYYDRMFSILLANIKKHKVVLLAVKQALFVKSSEDSSRKSQDEQEEQEMFQDHKVVQDDENDMDMEEGDVIENMTESEYLGYAWVSGVVCQVIVSKVRVDSKTHSGAFPKDVVVAGPRQAPRSVDSYCEHKEALFSVEVIKNKQSTKSYYVIGEEGVLWRRLAQIP